MKPNKLGSPTFQRETIKYPSLHVGGILPHYLAAVKPLSAKLHFLNLGKIYPRR